MGIISEKNFFSQMIEPSRLSSLLLSISIFFILHNHTFAATQSYIVYMGESSYGTNSSPLDVQKLTETHFNLLASLLSSANDVRNQMLYSYTNCFNGFAAVLDETQVETLRRNPNVISVFLNRQRKLHTTHSWDFLGLGSKGVPTPASLWRKSNYGDGVIIANLDTGVWPESPSFSDNGISPVPKRWRGNCVKEGGIRCSRKLIGARFFNKGYASQFGNQGEASNSPRDTDGHGSHTLSTAGGNFVSGANVFGIGNGTAKGGSPKAHVAAYKVCWPSPTGGTCFDSDIIAGFDAAIRDGVDVLSVSLGGFVTEFSEDGTAIGAFQAIKRGISVVISAGNEGPNPSSIQNVAPWLFTVGASTLDREFASVVTLGNKRSFKGASLSDKSLPRGMFYPLVNSADVKARNASMGNAQLCQLGSLDPTKVAGKIVVCLRGDNSRVDKGRAAQLAGAVGMILANDGLSGNEILSDAHILPASHLTFTDGEAVFEYIRTTKNPVASISPVEAHLGVEPDPVMAAFTSRGPSPIDPAILKPDVTAPGVDVIAAYSLANSPTESPYDKRKTNYITMSGTSMSCPHVSGIVGNLKAIHPTWTPAAIRSAIMTTAKTRANNRKAILDATRKPANPFAYGAGHVLPNRAADPGLVYDLTVNDYLNYLCARGYNQTLLKLFSEVPHTCPKGFSVANFNYPSISIPNLNGVAIVTRTVKNVGSPGTYTVRVKAPFGVSIVVEPKSLTFSKVGEEKSYKVTVSSQTKGHPRTFVFGQLIWSDGRHSVKSPLAVKHK